MKDAQLTELEQQISQYGGIGVLSTDLLDLIAALREARKDTARLNWLTNQTRGYGNGWVCRDSSQGRGMRLHETSRWAHSGPREAIDAAMAAMQEAPDGRR